MTTPGQPQRIRASVEVEPSEAADTLHFLGAFASVQSACELLALRYFTEQAGALLPLVQARVLARLTDKERIDLVVTLGEHYDYSGQTVAMRPTFYRAKQLRDSIAHSPQAKWMRDVEGIYLNLVSTDAKRRASLPARVTPAHVQGTSEDCAWFDQHVMRLGWEAGLFNIRSMMDDSPMEPPLPRATPPSRGAAP